MEKTEKPTPHRLKKAREEGQTFSSRPFESYIKLIIAIPVISLALKRYSEGFRLYFSDSRTFFGCEVFSGNFPLVFLNGIFYLSLLLIIIPVSDILLPFTYRPNLAFSGTFGRNIRNYFEHINPVNLFSKERLIKTALNFMKIIFFLGVVLLYLKSSISVIPDSVIIKGNAPVILAVTIYRIILFSLFTGLAVGLLDMIYERYKYTRGLYMTKQEIKEEFKNQEGDPEVKSRQKRFRHMILFTDMKRDVKKAKFLLVNPTHIAIPIIYSGNEDAPQIGYIGIDKDAQRMIAFAGTYSVPVVKNISLAREFFRTYEPGDEINEKHYEVIASLLAFVSSLEYKIDYIDMDR